MNDIISQAEASTSGRHVFVFVAASLGLLAVGLAFAYGVFAGFVSDPATNQTYLGVILAVGFALLGVMLYLYFRMAVPHRIVLEYDEDLW
jgi:hypothetical protein